MLAEAATPPLGGADAMLPRVARVRSRRHESADVWTLEIATELPEPSAFRPGQFNMLTAFGVGEIPVSFSGDPAQPERMIHTIRAVGAVSRALVGMRRGDPIGVRGPFGTVWPLAEAHGRDVLIMAGGLGIAPLRPALHELRARRNRYGRVVLLYGTRSPDDVLFARQLDSWRRRFDMDVQVTVDHATSEWSGDVGVVTALLSHVPIDTQRSIAFVCGPEIMMRASIASLRSAGVPEEAMYLSIERNMKCAVAWCGRCQFGTVLVCRDGPVFRHDTVRKLLAHEQI